MLVLNACVTTVRPPAEGDDSRPAFLLILGNHSNLVVTTEDGRLVRYGYGDWRWYAEGDTSLARGVAALLWPTPAALGRRELAGPPTAESLRRQIPLRIDQIYRINVSGNAIDALRAELDGLFTSAGGAQHSRADYGLDFIAHPQPYSAYHNSNRMVVRWLQKLGCEARGGHLLTRWRIEDSETE